MKIAYKYRIAAACLVAVTACASCLAAEAVARSAAGETLVYRPPLRGAPAKRVGGATRSMSDLKSPITVIAPGEVGLTTRDQPTVYWHVAQPSAGRMVWSLMAADAARTLAEGTLPDSPCTGFYRVSLVGARLEPGLDYRWQVAVLPSDPRESYGTRSGLIRFTQDVPRGLLSLSPAERRRALAEAGVWYDVVDELMAQMARPEGPAGLATTLGNLLGQGGIPGDLATSSFCN